LIVTSRREDYLAAVIQGHKEPIRMATVVELSHLQFPDDVEAYLARNIPRADANRWKGVRDSLLKARSRPLAKVLTNPLMLWLAGEAYRGKERTLGKLADQGRFANREAVQDHLLDQLIPIEFADNRRWTAPQAERWFAFLASDLGKTGSRDIAWWRLPEMTLGGRPVTFAIRGAILTAAAWCAAVWALHRLGNWYRSGEPLLLLHGPLGRRVAPIWTSLNPPVRLPTVVGTAIQSIPHEFALLELCAVTVALTSGALHTLHDIWQPSGATGYHINTTKIRPHRVFLSAAGALAAALAIVSVLIGVTAGSMPKNERSTFFASLFYGKTAAILIIVIFLWLLTCIVDPLTTERFVMDPGAAAVRSSKSLLLPSPDRALRLQQRHTLTILLWERTSRIGLVWLVFGSVIAVAYGAYELVAVSCRLSLGGRHSASDVFSDARLWLACTRRLPWRTMTFLAEAERLGILRLFGGVYRFRHIRLEQRLLMRHAPSRVGATDRAAAFDAGKEAPEVRESSPTDL
jgi:hypothetical protein